MARLPIPGSDNDTWGDLLNEFLDVSHNSDGNLQASAIQQAGAVTSVNGQSPTGGTVTLTASDIGVENITAGSGLIRTGATLSVVNPLNQSTTGNAATATNLAGGTTLPAYLAPAVVTLLQSGNSVAVNAAAGNDFRITLTASGWTIQNPSNPTDGQGITVSLTQDSTGSRMVTWASGWYFGVVGTPVLSTAAGATDTLAFKYYASLAQWVYMGSTADVAVPLSGGTMTGQLTAPDLAVSGLSGAMAASRYVGATTSGAPASGTFAVGDFVIDQTGKIWVCTTAPGTWTQIGGGGSFAPLASEPAFTPADYGFITWTYDPLLASATSATSTAGQVYLMRINLRAASSVTNIIMGVTGIGSGLTSGKNFAGIYSSSGSLVAQTADMTTLWTTPGNGQITMPLSGGPYALNAGWYWITMLFNGTTSPSWIKATNNLSPPNIPDFMGAAAARYATLTTTGQTSLPASFTPASATTLNIAPWWAAIS